MEKPVLGTGVADGFDDGVGAGDGTGVGAATGVGVCTGVGVGIVVGAGTAGDIVVKVPVTQALVSVINLDLTLQ